MGRTWFTADTHFNAEKLLNITGRSFDTIEEHNECILDGINSRVERNDKLIIVGDFAHNDPGHFRMRILCREVWLCYGNHDQESWGRHFSKAAWIFKMKLKGEYGKLPLWVHHFPTVYWDGSHHGGAHIYGHTHHNREETLDQMLPERRSIDVGVDNAYRVLGGYVPFSEEWLYSHFCKRKGHDDLNWYLNLHRQKLANPTVKKL